MRQPFSGRSVSAAPDKLLPNRSRYFTLGSSALARLHEDPLQYCALPVDSAQRAKTCCAALHPQRTLVARAEPQVAALCAHLRDVEAISQSSLCPSQELLRRSQRVARASLSRGATPTRSGFDRAPKIRTVFAQRAGRPRPMSSSVDGVRGNVCGDRASGCSRGIVAASKPTGRASSRFEGSAA